MTRLDRLRIVSTLGIIEIFAWGSSFYLMAVLAKPIAAETGWSAGELSAGVSVGLLVSGLAATRVGRLIEAQGGRQTLAMGMVLLAAGLVLLGLARSLPGFYAAWMVLGLGMSAGLYDAAFSTLGRIFGRDARAAIIHLTLWGGFASTVCWPLSAWLVEMVGWRNACFTYAGLHIALTMPLALLAIPRADRPAPSADRTSGASPGHVREHAPGHVRATDPRFLCIVLAGMIFSVISTIWSVHFVGMLAASGYGTAAAIGIGTLIGPAQVGARVLEMLGRGRHHPVWTMLVAATAICVGFGGLLAGIPAAAAMIAYGAGNGLWSIARGALPLAIFGPDGYARTMGRLAAPMLLAAAAAPSIGAWLIDAVGPAAALEVITAVAVVPVLLAVLLRWQTLRSGDRSIA